MGVYKALLLAGCAGTVTLAAPAMAQNNSQVDCRATPNNPACTTDAAAPAAPAAQGEGTIVVTGSRIARPEFDSNSPMVNVGEEFLEQSSTAAVEQQLNKLPQFVVSQSSTAKNNEGVLIAAGGDIQPNATNTPGAATVSLRGVGSNRTLVLVNSRRATPGNASGTIDVSTIPSAALERVEIISGGASATYGADAVAGVTNFILKDDFQGLELDGQFGLSQDGDAFEYQLGGIMGTDFEDGRGNISLAMSVNTREEALERDRDWYRDLWANPSTTSGQFFFVPRPGVNITPALPNNTPPNFTNDFDAACSTLPQGCVLSNMFPGANPTVPNETGTIYFNQDNSIFTTGFPARGGGSAFFKPWASQDTRSFWKTTDVGTLSYINAMSYLTVPMTRYNFLARGNYEINDWVGVFGQAMFNDSETRTKQEPGPMVGGWSVNIPWGSGVYVGNNYVPASVIRNGETFNGAAYVDNTPATLADNPTNPAFTNLYRNMLACATAAVGGCTNTQAFQQVVPDNVETILNARTNPNANFSLAGFLPNPRETFSEVTTYNIVAGLEGSIPGTDFTWEAFVNHGTSTTLSRQTGMYSLERTRAVFGAPNMGQGFSAKGNASGSGFGAATGTCATGMNFFQGYDGISNDCREAIGADINNKSETLQTIVEANLQGGLFDLPAGQLRFAIGASYRENSYTFANETLTTQGRSFNDQAIGIYPSANMDAKITVKEAYGELLIPVLADIPAIQAFNLEVGGRYSDYDTTGGSFTFKVLGDWEVTDWLRLRGGFNRAERAPNMAELLLTPQQTFRSDGIGDVCSTRHNDPGSANPDTNRGGATGALDVQAVCLEMMARDNNGTFVPTTDFNSMYGPIWSAFQPTGGGAGFASAVGNQVFRELYDPTYTPLKPEIADTWTAGAVIQSPVSGGALSRLNLTVDYFNIKIKDPIGLVPAGGILKLCVDPAFNPAVNGASAGGLGSAQSRAASAAALAATKACQAVFRLQSAPGFFPPGGFDTARVVTTYTNEGEIKLSGIDAVLSWSMDAGPGTVFLNVNGNYMIDFSVQEIEGGPVIDYVGTQGTGAKGLNFGSSFEYRIFANLGYSWGPANVSMQWQHIPATEDSAEANFLNGLAPAGTDNNGLPSYNLFNLNGSYEVTEDIRVRFGIDNVFNKRPPITGVDVNTNPANGELPGGGFSLFHDTQGRRFSAGVNLRF